MIIGASASGINCAKTLREHSPKDEIVLISKDDKVYSRCILHHYLSGHRDEKQLNFVSESFFDDNKIEWIKNAKVNNIDAKSKKITLEDGKKVSYDKLFIGSGASSFIPPVKNLREGKNVFTFRNLEDAQNILKAVKHKKNVLVLGAGLVGIDAVVGLMNKNLNLSILEMGNQILPMQLDFEAAGRYEKLFVDNGVNIYKNLKLEEVILNKAGEVQEARLSSGQKIKCDVIIVSTGVRANVQFLEEEGFNIDKGICIDDRCETSQRHVYAGGDVCGITPIWPMAVKQGIVAAHNMLGKEKRMSDFYGYKNSLNFLGLHTISLGNLSSFDESYEKHILKEKESYKKIITKNGLIHGAIVQGDVSYSGVLLALIKNKVDISKINKKHI